MRRTTLFAAIAFLAGAASGTALVAPSMMPGAFAAQKIADPAKAIAALESRVAALETAVERLASAIGVSNSGAVTISATKLKVNAPQFEVSAPLAKFGGIIKGKTVDVDSVVAKSYTPGAGNLW